VPDTLGGRYYAEWDDQAHAPSRVGWGALAASMVVPSLRVEFTVRGAHAPSRVGWGALAASMVALPLWVDFTIRASL